jgi:hypothetical protein
MAGGRTQTRFRHTSIGMMYGHLSVSQHLHCRLTVAGATPTSKPMEERIYASNCTPFTVASAAASCVSSAARSSAAASFSAAASASAAAAALSFVRAVSALALAAFSLACAALVRLSFSLPRLASSLSSSCGQIGSLIQTFPIKWYLKRKSFGSQESPQWNF